MAEVAALIPVTFVLVVQVAIVDVVDVILVRNSNVATVGAVLVLVSLVGAFVPAPGHYLVFAIAGGGAFLLAGILFAAWSWKRER